MPFLINREFFQWQSVFMSTQTHKTQWLICSNFTVIWINMRTDGTCRFHTDKIHFTTISHCHKFQISLEMCFNEFNPQHSMGQKQGKIPIKAVTETYKMSSACLLIYFTWAEGAFHICTPLWRQIIEIIRRSRLWNQRKRENKALKQEQNTTSTSIQ